MTATEQFYVFERCESLPTKIPEAAHDMPNPLPAQTHNRTKFFHNTNQEEMDDRQRELSIRVANHLIELGTSAQVLEIYCALLVDSNNLCQYVQRELYLKNPTEMTQAIVRQLL